MAEMCNGRCDHVKEPDFDRSLARLKDTLRQGAFVMSVIELVERKKPRSRWQKIVGWLRPNG